MAFNALTLDDLPKQMISIRMLRAAFDKCTPYDCPSRSRLVSYHPWYESPTDDISMEHAAKVIHSCVPHEYIDRFAFYFAGEGVAPYEVIAKYLAQTLVKT